MGIIFVKIMKSTLIALLATSAAALRVSDTPPFFNEPTWTEKMPSAGGFVQLNSCINANVEGVTCHPPNNMLFATGMNGDEDLGEDIIMKGEPYHYNQKKLAQHKLFATSMNGDEDLGEDIIMKGEPYHYNQKRIQSGAQFATGMNGDEDLGEDIIMKGEPYHY